MPTLSPCISVCVMDADSGWCRGCYRTIDEIVGWAQSDDAAKQAVWQALPERHRRARFAQAMRNQALMQVCAREEA